MRDKLEIYESLRKQGHTEEQALSETKAFLSPSNGNIDELVTKKDLKIAFLEFKEMFSKEYKLESLNIKMNLIVFGMIPIMMGCFGYIFKLLWEISSRLSK